MRIALLLLSCFIANIAVASTGLKSVTSPYSVSVTADRLAKLLHEKGMTVFKRINHQEGAKSVGMELRPTELIIFGNPKVGTPLMQCSQKAAIDLPQKALIWEDADGQVYLGYNDPEFLRFRHTLDDCDEVLEKISKALSGLATAAVAED